jgi:hypothetical protein
VHFLSEGAEIGLLRTGSLKLFALEEAFSEFAVVDARLSGFELLYEPRIFIVVRRDAHARSLVRANAVGDKKGEETRKDR